MHDIRVLLCDVIKKSVSFLMRLFNPSRDKIFIRDIPFVMFFDYSMMFGLTQNNEIKEKKEIVYL